MADNSQQDNNAQRTASSVKPDPAGAIGSDWYPLSFYAQEHNRSKEAITRWAREGGLTIRRLGRRFHIKKSHWLFFLDHGHAPPKQQPPRRAVRLAGER
jgi:hypothetical protein